MNRRILIQVTTPGVIIGLLLFVVCLAGAWLDRDIAAINIQADGDMQSLDRQLQHVVERVEDVTERFQRQQREMLRAEQLSAVGQLAASVAHEVRNPLTSVKMLVEAALRACNPKPLTADDLKVISRGPGRLAATAVRWLFIV